MATSRRTQLEQHTILCTRRDELEIKISEQEAFSEITAPGDYGGSTSFQSLDSLEKSLDRTLSRIATIERQLEL